MRRLFAIVAIALAISLVATACGASSSDEVVAGSEEQLDAASAPESDADADNGSDADDNDTDDSDSDAEPQTLSELLGPRARLLGAGRGQGPGNFDEDAQTEQQRLIQETIRNCMLNQGFEYTMEEATAGGARAIFASLRNVGADLPGEDYAAEYGYGISTVFDALLEQGPAAFGVGADQVDANQELLDSMSQAEADAWEIALSGVPPERDEQGRPIDSETGEVIAGGRGPGGFEQGGCRGEAVTEIRGDFTALEELADEFEELAARIDADPRLAEMQTEWASCMGDAGYSFDTVDEARADIQGEFRPMIRELFGFGRGGPQGGTQDDESGTGLTDEQEATLAALQQRERSVAVADYACGNEFVEEIATIRANYEAEFIEQNRAALEAVAG